MKQTFRCHTISSGYAAGEALLSRDPVLFYQTDFTTGVFREPGHDLEGKCIAGKIIIFPGGKGSSVVQADGMYKLDTAGPARSSWKSPWWMMSILSFTRGSRRATTLSLTRPEALLQSIALNRNKFGADGLNNASDWDYELC